MTCCILEYKPNSRCTMGAGAYAGDSSVFVLKEQVEWNHL